jgi:hypothetical protein
VKVHSDLLFYVATRSGGKKLSMSNPLLLPGLESVFYKTVNVKEKVLSAIQSRLHGG